jgi:hypothetical protein
MKLILILSLFSNPAFSKSALYCGKFYWSGKFAFDNIWIEDGKFNPSITTDSKGFTGVYNELGLQNKSDGDCICLKGEIGKAKYETSGEKGFEFKQILGLYACHTHVEIKTDIKSLGKLGLELGPHFEKFETVLSNWGLRKGDILMSVYDKNFPIKDEASLKLAVQVFQSAQSLKFRVIREESVVYVDYMAKPVLKP